MSNFTSEEVIRQQVINAIAYNSYADNLALVRLVKESLESNKEDTESQKLLTSNQKSISIANTN